MPRDASNALAGNADHDAPSWPKVLFNFVFNFAHESLHRPIVGF